MILYENKLIDFINSANDKRVVDFFAEEFTAHFSRKIDNVTKVQWKYTIQCIKELLKSARLAEETGIRIDYVIAGDYKWFEVILAGGCENNSRLHVIEMLPFDRISKKQSDEVYSFQVDDKEIEFVHPSLQSMGYKAYLRSNLDIVMGNASIDVVSSVYLFECDDEMTIKELYSVKDYVEEVPVYGIGQEDVLITQLDYFKNVSNGKEILMQIHSKDQLCSAGIGSYIDGLFREEKRNGLFSEQKIVASSVVSSIKNKEKRLFLLNGMAGTGKTTVAITVMKELKETGYRVLYLSGSLAIAEGISSIIRERSGENYDIKTIHRFIHEKTWDDYDVIIVDEAQNIGDLFIHKYLRRVSKMPGTILFITSMVQCISERGHDLIDEINQVSAENRINIKKYDLNSNIRFSGESSGINWLVHQLQIADTGNYEDWDVDKYNIQILDTPDDITRVIHQLHKDGELCRTIVRYDDVESISHKYGGPCITFEQYGFRMPVITASSENAARWYFDDELIDHAVGVQLVQGIELDYACVIISDITIDAESGNIRLTNEQKEIVINNKMATKEGYASSVEIDDYLKRVLNSYYIALSRGRKGVYIYCADDELRNYLKSRLFYASRRYSWIKAFIKKYDSDSETGIINSDSTDDIFGRKDKHEYVTHIYEIFNHRLEGIKSQLKDVVTEDVFKSLCDQFSDMLLDLQNETIGDPNTAKMYTDSIIKHMGITAWEKLSELSKKCLLSAEIIFHDLKDYNQLFDFSGVCVQVSKAVEYEFTSRYLTKYVEYLNQKYSDRLMEKIPKSLLDGNGIIKSANQYTLGDVRYTVGMDSNGSVKNNYVYNQFSYYAKDRLVKDRNNIKSILSDHIQIIHKIKEDYRNKAAHKSSIDVVTAKECIDYVVEAERKLGIMLDAYNY